jgi:serine/threonine-protein kinase
MAARAPGYNAVKRKTPTLFVSDLDAGEIRLYPADKKNPAQSGSITQGLDEPINAAADSSGTVYVANNGNSTVTEYPFGQTSPSVTLSTSLVYPNGIAVDSAGTVYVTSGSTVGNTYVLEFPKGATSPSAQVNGFGLAIGLSIDKNDNLYVADAHNNAVFEVAKGSTSPVNLGLSGLDDPTGVAIDPSGDLYVTNEFPPYSVNAFHHGKTSPFLSITDGIAGPYALAFDSKGVLFVGNSDKQPGYIAAYKKNKTSPYETFSNGIENPAGVAAYPPAF